MDLLENITFTFGYIFNSFIEAPGVTITAIMAFVIGVFSYLSLSKALRQSQKSVQEARLQSLKIAKQADLRFQKIAKTTQRQSERVQSEIKKLAHYEKRSMGLEHIHETKLTILQTKLEIALMRNKMDLVLNFSSEETRAKFKKYETAIAKCEAQYSLPRMRELDKKFEAWNGKINPGEYERLLPGFHTLRTNTENSLDKLKKMGRELAVELHELDRSLDNLE
ncbi:MAG: hypothetical protein GY862_28975 [Gammaproteobacteria bacterium]|nr:hypothetical protein [Gammaproteobacteria bacterium]